MHLDHFEACNMYILVYIMMYIFPDVNDSSMIGFLRRKLAASTSPRRLPGQRFFVPMRQ